MGEAAVDVARPSGENVGFIRNYKLEGYVKPDANPIPDLVLETPEEFEKLIDMGNESLSRIKSELNALKKSKKHLLPVEESVYRSHLQSLYSEMDTLNAKINDYSKSIKDISSRNKAKENEHKINVRIINDVNRIKQFYPEIDLSFLSDYKRKHSIILHTSGKVVSPVSGRTAEEVYEKNMQIEIPFFWAYPVGKNKQFSLLYEGRVTRTPEFIPKTSIKRYLTMKEASSLEEMLIGNMLDKIEKRLNNVECKLHVGNGIFSSKECYLDNIKMTFSVPMYNLGYLPSEVKSKVKEAEKMFGRETYVICEMPKPVVRMDTTGEIDPDPLFLGVSKYPAAGLLKGFYITDCMCTPPEQFIKGAYIQGKPAQN